MERMNVLLSQKLRPRFCPREMTKLARPTISEAGMYNCLPRPYSHLLSNRLCRSLSAFEETGPSTDLYFMAPTSSSPSMSENCTPPFQTSKLQIKGLCSQIDIPI